MDIKSSKYFHGTDSALVKTGAGSLKGIIMNSSSTGKIEISDGLDDSGVGAKAYGRLVFRESFTTSSPAVNIITFSTDNVADGDTLLIDQTTYTWRNTPAQANDVKIGATINDSITNMSEATRGVNVGTSSYAGTVSQSRARVIFADSTTAVILGAGFETFYNLIPTVLTSSAISLDGNTLGSSFTANPKENTEFVIGDKTYSIMLIFSQDLATIFGTDQASVEVPNEISADFPDSILTAINGDGGTGEGVFYSVGTEANTYVDASWNGSVFSIQAKNTGTYGNLIPVHGNGSTVGIIDNSSNELTTLTGGYDGGTSVMVMNMPDGSSIQRFKTPLEFYKGLYVTVTGTVDYTIIYE